MICSAISRVFSLFLRSRSCGKVMFSPCTETPQGLDPSPSSDIWPHCTGIPQPQAPQDMGSHCNTDLVAKIDTCSNVFTWTPPPTPQVLTFGGYWSTYGLQTGDTHRTEMLSCLVYLMLTKNSRLFPIFSVITYGILTSDCLMLWTCHSCAKNSPWAWHIKDKDIYSPERNICCPHQLLKICKAAKKKE